MRGALVHQGGIRKLQYFFICLFTHIRELLEISRSERIPHAGTYWLLL